MNIKLFSLLVLTSLVMLGCQSAPLLPVPKTNPPVAAVQSNPDAHKDQVVTWGGVILSSEAKKDGTEITILAKRLSSSTRPIESDVSLGRFITNINGFLDPAVFAPGREMSVNGIVTGTENRKVDDYDYLYPVVNATTYHLWPVRIKYEDDDYYWDPWYGPRYYPYPYYHRPHRTIKEVR